MPGLALASGLVLERRLGCFPLPEGEGQGEGERDALTCGLHESDAPDHERGINTFAAGHTHSDIAVGVTRRAEYTTLKPLMQATREEAIS